MATKLEMMKAAAEEANELLDMTPPIQTDLDTTEDMRKVLVRELSGELYDSDEQNFTPATWKFLTQTLALEVKADPGSEDAMDPGEAIPEKKAKPPKPAAPPKAKKPKKPADVGKAPTKRAGRPPHKDESKRGGSKKKTKSDPSKTKTQLIIDSVKKEMNSKNPNMAKSHLCDIAEVALKRNGVTVGNRSYTRLVVSIVLDTLSEFKIS